MAALGEENRCRGTAARVRRTRHTDICMTDAEDPERQAGFSRIDSPDGKTSLFHVWAGSEEDPARGLLEASVGMEIAMEREVLRRKGLDGAPGVEEMLQQKRVELREKWERQVRAEGVAPHLVQLLAAPSKRDAERLASSMVVTSREFANLVLNAHALLGYRHRLKVREYRPDHHAAFSDEVSEALHDAKAGPASPEMEKAMRKVGAMFDERKRVHAHLFERGAKWHCIFFDFNDMTDQERGPHLHYVSHRWTGLRRDAVLAAFDERRQSLPRRIHIQYVDDGLERAARRHRFMVKKGVLHVLRADPAHVSEPSDGEQ